jgi:predicted lipid-binding transport protein (Tim44 family)
VFGVRVRVPDSGLPAWQEAILTAIGCAIAFAILYGLYKLTELPAARRMRRRVGAVEAAAGDHPVFGAATVRAAAASLFRATQAAWDAGDRYALAHISAPELLADWFVRMDANAAGGVRYRVEVLKGPEIDYVGLVDEPGDGGDYVRVRIRARLRCALERPDGSRRPLPEANGSLKLPIEEYWTLARRDGEWIVYSIRPADHGERFLGEEIVGPLEDVPGSTA